MPAIDGRDSDSSIVVNHRAGDESAFAVLFEKHRDRVVRTIRKLVKSPTLVDDLTQQVFLQAFEALHSFRDEARFRTWLTRIAINVALAHLRVPANRRLDAAEPLAKIEDSLAFAVTSDDDPETSETWMNVVENIATLPPMQRRVLELRVFEAMSFRDIGTTLNSNAHATKASFHYAVKRLRELARRHEG
jgi:RNA polymerase sigma-70 factor (ECF subfamily)